MIRLSLKTILISLIVLLLILPGFGSAMTLDQIATTCMYSPGGGTNGTAATIGVNWTFTGLPGTDADVVNIGTSSAALLDFTIPAGIEGPMGPMNMTPNMTAGPQGINGTPGEKGDKGDNGTAGYTPIFGVDYFNGSQGNPGAPGTNGTSASVTINNTATLNAGQAATVTNIGNITSVILDFGIPKGDTGSAGTPGTNGTAGQAATISINNTATGSPGTNAQVSNIGNTSSAIFDFIIPMGATGSTGTPGTPGTNGTAATIAVNNTVTLAAGQSATVSNIGTSGAASFDFGIPQGAKGDKGDTGTIPDSTQFLYLNGTRLMTGDLNVNGNQILNLITGTSGTNAANKSYVDALPIYNATYHNKADTNYNASYATTSYVGDVNTSMKGYVDALPISNYNASYWTGTNYNASYITSTFNATYDAKNNYNSSYVTLDNTSYFLTDGSRTMLGNITFTGQFFINDLTDPIQPQDAATKKYVDDNAGSSYNASYWTGTNYNASYITSTYNATYDAKTNYNASYWTGTNYNSSYLTSTYNATYDAKTNYNSSYATITYVGDVNTSMKGYVDALPISNYNASYWTGTNYNSSYWTGTNYNASYLTSTYNATYDAKNNYNSSYTELSNTSYFLVDGSRALTGNLNAGSKLITSLITSASDGTSATNKTYVDALPIYNSSYLTSTYNLTYQNKANLTQYSYITLMAGSAMYPTTNPPSDFNQLETTTNKNNFIYANITNSSTQNVQWIVDMPADWNSGNTVIVQFLWTVQSGSGNANWTLSGLRFDNDAAIDQALPLITYKVDTVITANDLHVSDATVETAVTGSGNIVIFKVGRSATSDTLGTVPAQLIGVRLKYAKLIGAT